MDNGGKRGRQTYGDWRVSKRREEGRVRGRDGRGEEEGGGGRWMIVDGAWYDGRSDVVGNGKKLNG